MKCPFELPVKKRPDFNNKDLYRVESADGLFLSFSLKEDEVDYIVLAINSHERLLNVVHHLVESATRYPDDYATKNLNELIPYLIKEAKQAIEGE